MVWLGLKLGRRVQQGYLETTGLRSGAVIPERKVREILYLCLWYILAVITIPPRSHTQSFLVLLGYGEIAYAVTVSYFNHNQSLFISSHWS
jgi:hypothetical protein